MGIDATRKWPEEGFTRNWPKVIEMDAATKQRVDVMWSKLGLGPAERAQRFKQYEPR
jgi:4-hydroxy-3-polyprenylbenzoate decarboxylase